MSELGDPVATTDYEFCIYDGSVDQNGAPGLVLSAEAPAGPRWRATADGFAYSGRDRPDGGLRRVMLRAGSGERARVLGKARGANFNLPQLETLVLPLTVQLRSRDGTDSQCWSAQYHQPATTEFAGTAG